MRHSFTEDMLLSLVGIAWGLATLLVAWARELCRWSRGRTRTPFDL